jgi:hypothetical protein
MKQSRSPSEVTDVAYPRGCVEREIAEQAVLDVGGKELADHRCPRAVRACDRVEQHLGRLGRIDGSRLNLGSRLRRSHRTPRRSMRSKLCGS